MSYLKNLLKYAGMVKIREHITNLRCAVNVWWLVKKNAFFSDFEFEQTSDIMKQISLINLNLTERYYMCLKEKAKQLKTDVPAVFLALMNKKTPWYSKVFAAMTVVYALSPIDFIPDFIPVLGYLDDLIILPALVAWTVKFIPKNVFVEYRQKAQGMWQDGKPKKWYYAIPIIVVWFVILGMIVSVFI